MIVAEVNNLVGSRRKIVKQDGGKSYVVPDSILVGARDRNALETSLDAEQMMVRPNSLLLKTMLIIESPRRLVWKLPRTQ